MKTNLVLGNDPDTNRWRAFEAKNQADSYRARECLVGETNELPRLETYAGAVLFIVNAVPDELLIGPRGSVHELTAKETLTLLVYSYGRQTYSSSQIEKQLLWSTDPDQPQYQKIPTPQSIRRFRRNNLSVLITCIAKLLASSNAIRPSCEGTLPEKDYLAIAEDRVRTAMLLDMEDAF